MRVAPNAIVTIDYTLTDDTGEVLDSSRDTEPLSYIHGLGAIIPGLEAALEGRVAGDAFQIAITPELAYGHRDDSLQQVVARTMLDVGEELELGMRFQAETADGRTSILTITALEGDQVTLDGNHPLAGMTLHFDVKVMAVREATEEELDHGHAHDGHEHDH
jgi:FKBP-type peptidyl-prolyl cis-trans isomerase SlyD